MLNAAKNHLKTLIPDTIVLGRLVLRRAPLWREAGLIFVHVPKNGGTSINTAIYGRFMGHVRVRDIERVRPGLLEELPSLAVTRNPWARALSAWRFARRGASMAEGPQIRHAARYDRPEFASFERFVLDWLPGRDLDREDYVFRPQSHFLLDRAGQTGVTHLGRIEKPESYLPFLEETLGRPVEIGHVNRTGGGGHYREAYTPEMRDAIAQCYAADLERFGYDF